MANVAIAEITKMIGDVVIVIMLMGDPKIDLGRTTVPTNASDCIQSVPSKKAYLVPLWPINGTRLQHRTPPLTTTFLSRLRTFGQQFFAFNCTAARWHNNAPPRHIVPGQTETFRGFSQSLYIVGTFSSIETFSGGNYPILRPSLPLCQQARHEILLLLQ